MSMEVSQVTSGMQLGRLAKKAPGKNPKLQELGMWLLVKRTMKCQGIGQSKLLILRA
jgi:hypothetical protein